MIERFKDQTASTDPTIARAAELLSAMPPLDTRRMQARALPRLAAPRATNMGLRPGAVLAVTLATVAAAAATLHSWPLTHPTGGAQLGMPSGDVVSPTPTAAERGAGHATPPPLAEANAAKPDPVVGSIGRGGGAMSGDANDRPSVIATKGVIDRASPSDPGTMGNFPAGATDRVATLESVTVSPLSIGGPPSSARHISAGLPASTKTAAAPKTLPREVGIAEDESTLMVRAVRALRRDGDPARAESLAEQSLQRFPHGAQVEEAMALVMESVSAKGDTSGAKRAASAYLDQFRSGRFADRAQRILASAAR